MLARSLTGSMPRSAMASALRSIIAEGLAFL